MSSYKSQGFHLSVGSTARELVPHPSCPEELNDGGLCALGYGIGDGISSKAVGNSDGEHPNKLIVAIAAAMPPVT